MEVGSPVPFKVAVPPQDIERIMARVTAFEFPDVPLGHDEEWAYGTSAAFMEDLVRHWQTRFDWNLAQEGLNRFPQFVTKVGQFDIHYVLEKGSNADPRPLVLLHGWPGSYFEFLNIVEPLAHPERFGGSAEDGFDVVVPSLPGYGFSSKPPVPIGPRTIARHIDALMTQGLGFERYMVQGGDWGSKIGGWLGYEADACAAVHLNMYGWRGPGVVAVTDEEKQHEAEGARRLEWESGYFRIQSTKPLTLSYALMDSPVGVAAWIIEKFHGWSDLRRGFENTYGKDEMLTNVMIYLVTRTFATAMWLYRGLLDEREGQLPKGARIEKPVGIARMPVDLATFPPRSLVERSMNVRHWSEMANGGHFAALEEPDALVADVRAFASEIGY